MMNNNLKKSFKKLTHQLGMVCLLVLVLVHRLELVLEQLLVLVDLLAQLLGR